MHQTYVFFSSRLLFLLFYNLQLSLRQYELFQDNHQTNNNSCHDLLRVRTDTNNVNSLCVCGVCLVIYVTTEYLKGRRATRRVFYTIVHAWFMFEINCFSDRKCLICNKKKCSNFQHVVAGVEKNTFFQFFLLSPPTTDYGGESDFCGK